MRGIFRNPKLRLLRARHKKVFHDSFEGTDLVGWTVTGNWHVMTIDTNEDASAGLDGDLAINSAGSFYGGIMKRKIKLDIYGEIIFNHYVQNPNDRESPNYLNFYVDGSLKLQIKGASPWQSCEPIGLYPGEHEIAFEYVVEDPSNKKGVIDDIEVWECRNIDATITKYTPPKPAKDFARNNTLRGYTRFQEMVATGTEIDFTAAFDDLDFLEFQRHSNSIYYFIDEFGTCYRGMFVDTYTPEHVALNSIYLIQLSLLAGQKTGVGFIC